MSFSRSGGLLAVGVACVLAIPETQADIYRWVNEEGSVVYSDSPPADRNRVTDVFVSDKSAPSAPPASSPSLEMQALARQVEQLRDELAEERRARRAAEYAVQAPPPPAVAPAEAGACDPGFADCFWPGARPYFPATVIISTPIVHRVHRGHHHFRGDQHVPPRHFKRGPLPPSSFGEVRRVQRTPPAFHSGQRSFQRH